MVKRAKIYAVELERKHWILIMIALAHIARHYRISDKPALQNICWAAYHDIARQTKITQEELNAFTRRGA